MSQKKKKKTLQTIKQELDSLYKKQEELKKKIERKEEEYVKELDRLKLEQYNQFGNISDEEKLEIMNNLILEYMVNKSEGEDNENKA